MKITIEVDVSPNEFRASLGLPDVEPLQRDAIERLRSKMAEGLDAFDPKNINPMKLWQQYMAGYPQMFDLVKTFATAGSKSDSGGLEKDKTAEKDKEQDKTPEIKKKAP
ncbi:MAG: hypothetical protein HQL82_14780 [Magnetococcales bacterium]|nr:hypothetical protein [Magnetococcales bacterium]